MASNRELDFYLHQNYTIELKPYGDGAYFARIQELQGCVAEGRTIESTLELIEEAKEAWLEVALDQGETIPLPDEGRYSGRFLLRVPSSLHQRLVKNARKEKTSLNQYIQYLLTYAVGAQQPVTEARVVVDEPPALRVEESTVLKDGVRPSATLYTKENLAA